MILQESNIAEFRVPGEDGSRSDPEDIRKLSHLLEKYAPHDDLFKLTEEGIHVVKSSKITNERSYMLSIPGICLVPQGAKSISFAGSWLAPLLLKLVTPVPHNSAVNTPDILVSLRVKMPNTNIP